MPKKLQDAVKKNVKRHHLQARQRILSFVACILVFCMTYGVLLRALSINDPTENQVQLSGNLPTSNPTGNTSGNTDSTVVGIGSNLSGIWREDLLSIAEKQIGYSESTGNYVLTTDSAEAKGYTLFGDWYGNPYGDWAAMFVSYCLDKANIKNMPLDDDCQHWVEVLDAREDGSAVDRYFTPDEYTPRPGDLVFFDWEQDEVADHVGIVEEVTEAVGEGAAQIKTIEGDSDDKVQKVIYSADDSSIMGYAKLPVQPYTYSDDRVQVEVTLPEDSAVPRNAQLKVTPIESDSKSYSDLTKQAQNAVNGSVETITLYDISFYTADQEYIPVDEKAKVTMRFGAPVASSASTDVVVLHYDDNDSNPVALEGIAAAKQSSADAAVDFETEGFSIFAVVEVAEASALPGSFYPAAIMTGIDVNNLNGVEALIATADRFLDEGKGGQSNRVMMPTNDRNQNNQLAATGALREDNTLNVAAPSVEALSDMMWVFEANADTGTANDYYIKSKSSGKYLYSNGENVSLTDINGRALYSVTEDGDTDEIVIENINNNRKLSINAVAVTFTTYSNPEISNNLTANNGKDRSKLILAVPQIETTKVENANVLGADANTHPLNGKIITITTAGLQNGAYYALSADRVHVDEYYNDSWYSHDRLLASAVAVNGNDITASTASALWKFTAVEGQTNRYYVESVDRPGYYLNINPDGANGRTAIISQNQQAIEVTVTNGNLQLRGVKGDAGDYLMFDQKGGVYGDINPDVENFTSWGPGDAATHMQLSEYVDPTNKPEGEPVNDLAGREYVIVTTQKDVDANEGPLQVVSSGTTIVDGDTRLQGVAGVYWVDNYEFEQVNVPDGLTNVYWTFEPLSAVLGLYAIKSNAGYLHIDGDGKASVGNAPQYINVVSYTGDDGREYVGFYYNGYYLNRYADNTVYGGWNDFNAGSSFVLAVPAQDALIGPDNDNAGDVDASTHPIKVVEPDEAPGVKVSLFNYDETVNTDEVSGGLANQAVYSAAYAAALEDGVLTEEEADDLAKIRGFRFFQQAHDTGGGTDYDYDYYYTAKYGSENKDQKYNYVVGGAAKGAETGLLYGLGYIYDNYGYVTEYAPPFSAGEFVIGNKALTAEKANALSLNGAVDGAGFWGWNLAADELNNDGIAVPTIRNKVSVKLDADGYPHFYDNKTADNYEESDWDVPEGSLGYLFGEHDDFVVDTMDNGGGLFQVDDEGYYYYHSEINAAYYDEDSRQFVLYDHAVRPNYTPANSADEELGNFLPFNSLGTVGADGTTVNWWTADGKNYNDLDPTGFEQLDNYGPNNKTDPDAEHFTWPVLAKNGEPQVCSAALAETNLVDMWFGMMIEIEFYMPKDGTVNGKDMIFSFSGDDDVFVYVDDVLLLNIGGIHGAQSGEINFTKGTFNNYDGYSIPDMVGDKSDAKYFDNRFDAAGLYGDEKGWVDAGNDHKRFADYTKHTLKFFYMERGGNISHCGIRFNMPPLPENSLTVTKELDDSLGDPVPDYVEQGLEYTFRVINATYDDEDYGKPYFPEGTEFSILYDGQMTDRKGKVAADGTFTLKPNESARFTNMLDTYGNIPYMVQELVSDTWTTQYSRVEVNGVEVPSSRPFLGPDGTLIYQTPEQIEADSTNFVVFSNVLNSERSRLLITKAATEGSDFGNQLFNFEVKIGGKLIPEGTPYKVVKIDADGIETSLRDATVAAGGIVQASVGETVIIDDLVVGVSYDVFEIIPDFENEGDKYAAMYSGTITDRATQATTNAPNANIGDIPYNSDVHVTVTNSKQVVTINIPINKTITDGYLHDAFTFRVIEAAMEGGVWIEQGMPITEVTINAFDPTNITIDLPQAAAGTYYWKVFEKVNPDDSYVEDTTFYILEITVEEDGDTYISNVLKNGTELIYANGDFTLTFDNLKTTSVTITKDVVGGNPDDVFRFTVTVTDKEGNDITNTLAAADRSFTLKNGGRKVISGLPIGAIVTVVEEDRIDYKESFTMSATYEAEYGTSSGGAVVSPNASASGSAHVGNIQSDTATVTIPIISSAAIGADMRFWYASAQSRNFTIDLNGNPLSGWSNETEDKKTLNNGSWSTIAEYPSPNDPDERPIQIFMTEGDNTITFGGTTGNFAPNLDKIHLTFGSVVGNEATINLLGDDAQITFHNEPVKTVTVEKTVEGENADKNADYTFTATIKMPNGSVVSTVTKINPDDSKETLTSTDGKYTFTLQHGQHIILADLPTDAIVQISETEAPGYYTSYEVVSRYEAEDAERGSGVTTTELGAASNGEYAGRIGEGESRTITFTVNSDQERQSVLLRLCYASQQDRQFRFTVNGQSYDTPAFNTGGWYNWNADNNTAEFNISLRAGENTIVIGGVPIVDATTGEITDYAAAPNLDYIEIVWAKGAGRDVPELGIPDDYDVRYTNHAGVELPETGGPGTLHYTLGGLLLMAIPLLYGCIRKRKREGGAEA